MPVWPTWSVCGRQPAIVTTREQPTAAFRRPASSSRIPKPSAEPTPRPPLMTTLASAREMPLVSASTRSATCTARSDASSSGSNGLTSGASAPLTVVGWTACGAHDSNKGEPCMRASSRRLPPHLTRVTVPSSLAFVQFAANGRSSRAATWAITSLPLFEPAATMALGFVLSIVSVTQRAHAAGAYAARRSSSVTWAVVTPCAPSSVAASAPPGPTSRASCDPSALMPRASASACNDSSSGRPS